MAEIEKITEKSLLPLFTELRTDQIPLKMLLASRQEPILSYITDIRKRRRTMHFVIKAPDTRPDLETEKDRSVLQFEFTDKESIKYVFETEDWELSEDSIWVKFPAFVNRFQRRKLYRLDAPHGTRLFFKVNDTRYKLLVVNVSLGGTLGVLVSLTKQMEKELKLCKSETLEDVELVFPSENRKHAGSIVKIKRCQIKRQERNPITRKFECAIEFKEMNEGQQKSLRDLFYKWQREYLRRRKLMCA
jgi:c-di-GMP-binding flagellar brake protein YcgR